LNIDSEELEKKQESFTNNDMMNFYNKVISSEIINYLFIQQGANSKYYFSQVYRKNAIMNIFFDRKNKNSFVFEKTTENAKFFPLCWTEDYVLGIHPEMESSVENTIPDALLDNNNKIKKNIISEFDNPILIKYCFKKTM